MRLEFRVLPSPGIGWCSRLTVLPTDPHDAARGQSPLYPMGFFEARLRNSERHGEVTALQPGDAAARPGIGAT